jgi:hypothetical protein
MKFFAVLATLFAAAAAHYSEPAVESCSTVIVTVTVPYGHVPTGPASHAPTLPPYPTTGAPYTSEAPVPSGTGHPVPPPPPAGTGTGYSVPPVPSGTGSYSAPPPLFTGAASNMKIPAAAAGLMGLAAYLL